ncbi:hypothetical protein TYRP_000040 [Tyrophagus putrescentiae]|nr:hypothetical protein TYRP_000040 [Tyrophagus putrescentiae]
MASLLENVPAKLHDATVSAANGFHNAVLWTLKKIWSIPEDQRSNNGFAEHSAVPIIGFLFLLMVTLLICCIACYCFNNCREPKASSRDRKKKFTSGLGKGGGPAISPVTTTSASTASSSKSDFSAYVGVGGGGGGQGKTSVATSGFGGTSVNPSSAAPVGNNLAAAAGKVAVADEFEVYIGASGALVCSPRGHHHHTPYDADDDAECGHHQQQP